MDIGEKVSVRSLRILTYTILIKAVISTVILLCKTVTDIKALQPVPYIFDIQILANAADFINIVACVMCIGGVAALSKKMVMVHRTIVGVLLLQCIMILLMSMGIYLMTEGQDRWVHAVITTTLLIGAAARLLVGAAFLFWIPVFICAHIACFFQCSRSNSLVTNRYFAFTLTRSERSEK